MKDAVTMIGTVGVLAIAWMGLRTWRRQLLGTTEYDVAKRAVLLTYKVRDAIQAVRSPLLHLRKEEVEAGRRLEEEKRIYGKRVDRLQERWAELRTVALESRVIWGEGAEKAFDPIKELIGTLEAELWLHFWLKGAYAAPGATIDDNPNRVAANERIIYFTSETDEFSRQINAAVNQIETFFKKHIRG